MSAAAAAIGQELTVPGVSQSVVLTRLANRTRSSMSAARGSDRFAAHGVTMAIFLSAARPRSYKNSFWPWDLATRPRRRPSSPSGFRGPMRKSFAPPSGPWPRHSRARRDGHGARPGRSGPRPDRRPQRSHVYSASYAHPSARGRTRLVAMTGGPDHRGGTARRDLRRWGPEALKPRPSSWARDGN